MQEDLVRGYYDKRAEEEWFRHDRHRMEFAVTRRLLETHLPPSGHVLDCGGGPGRYALWLAGMGYDVTLFDLSRRCLDWADKEARTLGVSVRLEEGTATDLSRFSGDVFDAVLLMGPLYHLESLESRRQAVQEAVRVLKPNGLLAASFLTRTAALRFVAKERARDVLELYGPMLSLMNQGYDETFPPADDDHLHAYFAHPDEVEPLLADAGLTVLGTYATEGFISMIDETVNTLEGPEWAAWVELNLLLASDRTLFSGAEHLLAIARKP
jgi:2-polyprenyl-3-methyl-5-hydroxy-6-metoxy-1,4-benzoquinol methylase